MPIREYFGFYHALHLLPAVFGIHFGCGEKKLFNNPSKPFYMIIVGFVIRKNVSTSEPFARDLVPILDSSKSLAEYIHQVDLAARSHSSTLY